MTWRWARRQAPRLRRAADAISGLDCATKPGQESNYAVFAKSVFSRQASYKASGHCPKDPILAFTRFKCCSRPAIADRRNRVKSDVFISRFIRPSRVSVSESVLNENTGRGCVHVHKALFDFAPRNLLALIAQTHSRHTGGNVQAVLALDRYGLERN